VRAFRFISKSAARALDAATSRFKAICDPRSVAYQKLEARVPEYKLPDPLVMSDGSRVKDPHTWRDRRRPEILECFRTHVYGRAPESPAATPFSVLRVDSQALGWTATRKEVRVGLGEQEDSPSFLLLLYVPNRVRGRRERVPIFLGLNFFGNHTVHIDPGISLPTAWIPNNSATEGRPAAMLRGLQSSSWPVEFILQRGYGLATAYCGEIVPDRPDGLEFGVHRWYRENLSFPSTAGSWGAIGGWAWGLSRAMDYLEHDPDVDHGKVVVIGHSRLGKAALWAGACDERFGIVISNNSGCGGAALSRRRFGETVAMMNSKFPHWFCGNFKRYNDREEELPVDQHELISLVAPRPVYVASAQRDLHADPMGEFLATKHAGSVYRLLGNTGLPTADLPPVNMPVMGGMGYHLRRGGHGITSFDWMQYLKFTELHFANGYRSSSGLQ